MASVAGGTGVRRLWLLVLCGLVLPLAASCNPGAVSLGGGIGVFGGEDIGGHEIGGGHGEDDDGFDATGLGLGLGLTLGTVLTGGEGAAETTPEAPQAGAPPSTSWDAATGGLVGTSVTGGGVSAGSAPGGSASGGTTTSTPASNPPSTPASTPASTPPPGAMICGPDVTANVEAVLDQMTRDFRSWSASERLRRCTALYAPTSYEIAWDILQMSPRVTPLNDDPTTPEDESTWPAWFERISPNCAIPRFPCGPTVTFHGMCVHAQILNYMQWGLMNRLCGGGRAQDYSLIDWDAAAGLSARARTLVNGLSGGNFASASAVAEEQILFTELGARYADITDTRQTALEDYYIDQDEGPDIRSLERTYSAELATAITTLAGMTGRAVNQCQLACRLTVPEQAGLDIMDFGYIWGDYRFEGNGDPWFAGGQGGGRRGRATTNVIPGAPPPAGAATGGTR
ncbi:MAG: hypothetical protein RLO50_00210 [Azospirillaceae bacterium]